MMNIGKFQFCKMLWRSIAILVLFICSELVHGEQQVPCHFIFGDSLSDPGNNNNLETMAKSNYSPYGIDFPGGVATGRFTNGLTVADFITQYLGFEKLIAPYSTAMGQDILRGVNYASGSAGILNETGSHMGKCVWMDWQLQNYKKTISQLESMVKGPVSNYLNKCLYSVNIGSNDYINNYLVPSHYPSKKQFTPDQFAQLLITRYQAQLQALYDSGARKIAIYGLAQIGCIPAQLAMNNATQCVKEINEAVGLFNTKLEALVKQFNAKLHGAKFTFIDLFTLQKSAPIPPGFVMNSPCCKVISNYMCEPNARPCEHRNMYGFIDGYHPTEFVNQLAATAAYDTIIPIPFVRPMSIKQLSSS